MMCFSPVLDVTALLVGEQLKIGDKEASSIITVPHGVFPPTPKLMGLTMLSTLSVSSVSGEVLNCFANCLITLV